MPVIVHPRRFSGGGSVEVVQASAAGVSFDVRKRDGESILTLFLGWSELSRLVRDAQSLGHRHR